MMKQSAITMQYGSCLSAIFCLLVLSLVVFAVPQGWAAENAYSSAKADKKVVEVNGVALTQNEVDQKIKRTVESLKDQIPPDKLEEFKINIQGKIVDDFITRTLISQEMDEQKITVDESEVKKAVSEVMANVPQGMTLEAMLKQGGVTMEEMQDNIRFSLRAVKLFEAQVKSDYIPTTEEVTTYYNENKKQYDQVKQKSLNEVKGSIEEMLKNRKRQESTQNYIEGLKQKAKIVYRGVKDGKK